MPRPRHKPLTQHYFHNKNNEAIRLIHCSKRCLAPISWIEQPINDQEESDAYGVQVARDVYSETVQSATR